jgi:hypothetical protein
MVPSSPGSDPTIHFEAGVPAPGLWRAYREAIMALEMKPDCERCGAPLTADGAAHICSYECTFCAACAEALSRTCPNCGGVLVPRPRRR